MDFWLTMRAAARRWYVTVPTLVLVLAIAGFAATHTTHQYESSGTIILSEPDPSKAAEGRTTGSEIANPLLAFGGSLITSAALLIQNLNSPDAQKAIAKEGGTATITASDGKLNGPFIVVVADNPAPDVAQRTVTLAFQYAEQELQQREQALGAPPSQFIEVKTVVQPSAEVEKKGGKSRFLLATTILSLCAALTAVYAAETIGRRRQRTNVRTA